MKTRTELENELKLLESGADAIRQQLAAMPKQWEPEGGLWLVSSGGHAIEYQEFQGARDFGSERKTREAAERAAIEMRKFNRLLAYRDEFAPGYEPDWRDNCGKFHIYFDHSNGTFDVDANQEWEAIGTIYMPKSVAIELCRKLNSGEVVL